MIVEKIITIIAELILVFMLCYKLKKSISRENLVIIPLCFISTGIYIFFVASRKYIPIYLQISIFLFGFLLPVISSFLQYNNIMIKRKLLYYRMKYLYNLKEYEKVIKYIIKLVALDGRTAEYLYILGMCYKNLDDYINARDSFALATELDKGDYKSYYELGRILDETNKKETAIVMFNKAIKIKPDFYEAREALGICYTSQGKFKEAINVYKKALEKHPDSYEIYYNIAIIELELEEYDEAKAAFKKAGEIKNDLYTAFYNLGNICYLLGEYDEAIEAYRKMLNSGVYGPKAYYKIAVVYACKKEYEKALATLEYAIELDPKYIKKSRGEYAFENMRKMIDNYLIQKEVLETKEKEKKDYMKYKFKIFKKDDDLKLDNYSNDYNTYNYNNINEVKHA